MIDPRVLSTWRSFYEERDGVDASIIVALCDALLQRLRDPLALEQRVAALECRVSALVRGNSSSTEGGA